MTVPVVSTRLSQLTPIGEENKPLSRSMVVVAAGAGFDAQRPLGYHDSPLARFAVLPYPRKAQKGGGSRGGATQPIRDIALRRSRSLRPAG